MKSIRQISHLDGSTNALTRRVESTAKAAKDRLTNRSATDGRDLLSFKESAQHLFQIGSIGELDAAMVANLAFMPGRGVPNAADRSHFVMYTLPAVRLPP